jgi:hypothetical protein
LQPSALILALALYPLVSLAAPWAFFKVWPERLPPASSADVATEAEKATTARLAAILSLFTYGSLVSCTLLWEQFSPVGLRQAGFHAYNWQSSVLRGGYGGMSWAGASIWLLAVGFAAGRLRREVPGLGAPLKIQMEVWLLGAFAEESWRVIAITAFLSTRYSPILSVVAVALAFATAFLGDGLERAALAWLEGVVYGALFLWQGSFLAPFAAHLMVQAVYLWGVGQFSADKRSRKTWQIPGTKCPVCGASLSLLQVELAEVFQCPACGEPLSLSDGYQNTMRFAGGTALFSLSFCSIAFFYGQIPFNLALWFIYPVTWGAMTSGASLYKRVFTRLFPPQLQRGTPNFITLDLEGRRPQSQQTKTTKRES